MKLGLNIPVRNNANGDLIREFCVMAEDLGFASLWQGDHVVIPDKIESEYPYAFRFKPDIEDLFPDPAFVDPGTMLSFAAGCTKNMLLGTSVLVVPMRNPLVLAKQLSTLSVVSNGRAIAGVGVGWMKEEFDALHASWEKRGARTDEYVKIMQLLWKSEEPVSFQGEFYSFNPVRFRPRPVGNKVPIWVGGHTERALKRTARYGDGWYAVELPPDQFAAKKDRLLELWAEEGREGRPAIALSRRLRLTGGDIRDSIEMVKKYEEIGTDHFISYATTARSVEDNIERMQRVAREIMPQIDQGVASSS